MRPLSTPALEPVACLLAGATYAAVMPEPADRTLIPLAAVLAGLGWSLGSRFGCLAAWCAVGLLLVLARPESSDGCLDRLDPARPVVLIGTPRAAWQPSEAGWRSQLSVERARQGPLVVSCRELAFLSCGGSAVPLTSARIRVKGFLKRSRPLRNAVGRLPLDPPWPRRYRMHLKSSRFVSDAGPPTLDSSSDGARGSPGASGRRARAWVRGSFEGVESRPGVGAARALLLGERDALDPDLERSLRRFGLSHLFAVSGLHVALLAVFAHWLLRALPRRPRLALTTIVVLGYLVLVGARPSIVRATAMFVLAFGAIGAHRPPHGRQALCLAAGFLIVLDPSLISNLGFRLTVSATAGILWLSPALESRWKILPRPLRRSLAATVAAQLGSMPWTLTTFSVLHPLAPLMNLLAVPWMAAFAMLSVVGCAAMRCWPATRASTARTLDLAVEPLQWLDALPASGWLALPLAPSLSGACLLAGCLGAALLLERPLWRLMATGVAALVLAGPSLPAAAEMIAIDVGQGDAILLHDAREAILVDGGGWRNSDIAASVLVPALARLGVRRLASAIVTHPDVDHCRGLLDLSYYVPIDLIASPPGVSASPCVRRLVARPGTRWRELWGGQAVRFGRIDLQVLHPAAGSENRGNDSSLVLRALVGRRSMLLSGDIEAGGERALLGRTPPARLESRVLKLAHHGSRTSTTEAFLDAVAPRVAVVSAGRANRYGHPSRIVLERCRRRGIRVVRTDRDGMIRLALEPIRRAAGAARAGAWFRGRTLLRSARAPFEETDAPRHRPDLD